MPDKELNIYTNGLSDAEIAALEATPSRPWRNTALSDATRAAQPRLTEVGEWETLVDGYALFIDANGYHRTIPVRLLEYDTCLLAAYLAAPDGAATEWLGRAMIAERDARQAIKERAANAAGMKAEADAERRGATFRIAKELRSQNPRMNGKDLAHLVCKEMQAAGFRPYSPRYLENEFIPPKIK